MHKCIKYILIMASTYPLTFWHTELFYHHEHILMPFTVAPACSFANCDIIIYICFCITWCDSCRKIHGDNYISWSDAGYWFLMITSWNGNIFRVTGPLCREFTGHWWIPLTKASDAELWCFLWSAAWVHNREAGDLRRHRAHYDVIVM